MPSKKRTCVSRPKPSSVEKLTKDRSMLIPILFTIIYIDVNLNVIPGLNESGEFAVIFEFSFKNISYMLFSS